MKYPEQLIDPKIRKHRIRTNVGVSEYVGCVVRMRIHESNERPMYQMDFGNSKHEKMWGGAWFYFDDLEAVKDE